MAPPAGLVGERGRDITPSWSGAQGGDGPAAIWSGTQGGAGRDGVVAAPRLGDQRLISAP